ncbi:diacylglycerol kinase family protein [uncultured Actinobaculum sp.]|uniref:diacylglycerol/lipid kinase family protein n=1 Tax=uncultured Actinobaculum sp. TaxID=655643 RepID=UPI0028050E8E|nr:diacylglycerol kinase family protein [uncultured Actinobaculum sp.]
MNAQLSTTRIERIAFLYKIAANTGKAGIRLRRAIRAFKSRGITVVQSSTKTIEATRFIARRHVEAGDVDAIVVFGGDGFLHAVLQEVALTDMPVGIIPAGSGNDFARHLGVDSRIGRAVDELLAGNVARLDLGRATPAGDAVIGGGPGLGGEAGPVVPTSEATRAGEATPGQWFASVGCIGFDSRIVARTNTFSWPRGTGRYVLSLLLELPTFGPVFARISVDGEVVHEGQTTLCAVGNTAYYGGGFPICAGADPTDGLLDITVVGGVSRSYLGTRIYKLFTGSFSKLPEVGIFRGKSVRVEGAAGLISFGDGEAMYRAPYDIELVERAVSVIVPPRFAH